MNAICLFPVNLYGPGDNFDVTTGHVIPGMIRKFVEAQAANQESVVLWGDGTPTREFLYVDDAARAFRLALEGYDGEEPVNIGSGEELSIRALAHQVRDAVGYAGQIEWDLSKPNGQPRRRLDTSRARECFGFSAQTKFASGLNETINWYLSHRGMVTRSQS
jgi:GDP-L-fucose synthase